MKNIIHEKIIYKISFNKNKQFNKVLNNNIKENILKTIFSLILLLFYKLIPIIRIGLTKNNIYIISKNKMRVGVTCLQNSVNVGNILVKYAMLKKLEEFGCNVTLLIPDRLLLNRSNFINKTLSSNLYLIENNTFNILNENNFDYLLVNSDQTWAYNRAAYFYDIGFLKFAKDWKVKKFIYGASI